MPTNTVRTMSAAPDSTMRHPNLELLESSTLDGRIQELVYRATLH